MTADRSLDSRARAGALSSRPRGAALRARFRRIVWVSRARRAASVVGVCLALVALAPRGSAQALAASGETTQVRALGAQHVFPAPDDPDHLVWVFLGGVEVQQGERLMLGRRLVLVLDTTGSDEAPASDSAGFVVPNSRVLEMFLEGDVSLDEAGEQVLGAESLHVDNVRGTLSLEKGTWRAKGGDQALYVHFESMRRLADGTRELQGVRATTCSSCDPDWDIRTARATLQETSEGDVLHTAGNTVEVGGFPVFWLPGAHLNVDKDRPPLKAVEIGSSRRFGTEVITTWGGDASEVMTRVGESLGVDGPVSGDWSFRLANYTDRGVFYEPTWEYETADSKGKLFGAYIRDRAERDFLPPIDQDIDDKSRGRVDLAHRTRIDDTQTVDVELSYLSDAGFLREYYESESRIGKEQETYVNWRDLRENAAWQVLARTRVNDFDSQVEYLPRVENRVAGERLDLGALGTPVFSNVAFADAVRNAPGEDPTLTTPQPDSYRNTRVGSTGTLTWPFDLDNGDRVQLQAGYDLTAFDRTVDVPGDPDVPGADAVLGGADLRYALNGGVEWSRTYSGVGEAQSDLWNFDGVRHILEPRAGYLSVFELNRRPPELVPIDDVEMLDKDQRFVLGLRHRVQTHQEGQVKTVLNTDLSIPFFPNEDRDNEVVDFTPPDGDGDPDTVGDPEVEPGRGRTSGDITLDTRWTPGADIFGLRDAMVRVRTTVDPNDWSYKRAFLSYQTKLTEQTSFAVSQNKARHAANFFSVGVESVLTERWSLAVFAERDLRESEAARRGVVVRQTAECWMMDLEASQRRGTDTSMLSGTTSSQNRDEYRVTLRFWPRVGSSSQERSLLQSLGRVR